MKNYFSRLAKQSGLRFSEQNITPRVSANDGKDKNKPLHNEETIFVSAPENRPQPVEKRQSNTPQTFLPKRPNKKITENESVVEIPPQIVEKTVDAKTFLPETKIVEIKNQSKIIGNAPVIEEIVFGETKPETSLIFPPDVAEIKAEKENTQKIYFEKTEKILEEGGVSKEETGRTILQEIQQWVADAPDLTENYVSPDERTIKIISSPVEKAENSKERENGQVSILEEQNLSLSIGKISVYIEGGEEVSRRAEVVPPNNSGRSNERKSERSFSRLSRYYL